MLNLFAGTLGTTNTDVLQSIVARGELVFPTDAGSQPYGRFDSALDEVLITGPTTFAPGGRYCESTGVAFALLDVRRLRRADA